MDIEDTNLENAFNSFIRQVLKLFPKERALELIDFMIDKLEDLREEHEQD